MDSKLLREITPLTQNDCFTFFYRTKDRFDFPLHYHDEFELNFIKNAKGAKRVIGEHQAEIDDFELVLVGPNLPHAWFTHNCKTKNIQEITIQFHRDLFDEKFLQRNQLNFIKRLLERSLRGLCFSKDTARAIMPRLVELTQKQGFDSVLELMSILHDLSTARNVQSLCETSYNHISSLSYNSARITKSCLTSITTSRKT